MRRNENTEHIEGYVYSHTLTEKIVQNKASTNYGKPFLTGELHIAVDEDLLNVIPVHFTYVTEKTSKGEKNITYANLKKIMDENKTVEVVGKDAAQKVKINTAIALNDFYNSNDDLISTKVNEGGFVSFTDKLLPEKDRNTFSTDMLITNVSRKEASEADPEEYTVLRGAIFNFRNAIMPVEFQVKTKAGMEYFEGLEVTGAEPIYTKVWGKINCETKTKTVSEESAFGEAAVKTYSKAVKEWNVTGASKVPFLFDDEETITRDEVTKAMQDRQTMLAEIKKRSEEYKAQKANGGNAINSVPSAAPVKKGDFNF